MKKLEPQCKTHADLYREWARVLDMCAGTSVNPVDCWKQECQKDDITIIFDGGSHTHEFAIAIIEERPVFRGDRLFRKNPRHFESQDFEVFCIDGNGGLVDAKTNQRRPPIECTWNPPKHKFNDGDCVYCKVNTAYLQLEGTAKIISSEKIISPDHPNGLYKVRFDDCGIEFFAEETMLSKHPPKPKTISLIDVPAPSQSGYMRTCDDKELIWNMRFDSSEDALNFAKEIRRTTFK